MSGRTWYIGWGLLALGVWCVLGAANLYYGELNQDEGWYLYAARLAAEGQQPYEDFAFTQGPVFLRVYSLVQPIVEHWGLMGGRIVTAMLGLVAVLLGGLLAARLTVASWRWPAASVAVILLLCNVYHNYYSLMVKTYSLCAVLLVGGLLCLTEAIQRRCKGWALAAGLLLAWAAGVRLSVGVWLPLAGLYMLWMRRDLRGAWIYFGIGGGAGLLMAFGPSFIKAPEQTWFWLVQYHAAREGGGLLASLVFKAGFLSRFVQAYFVLCVVIVATVLFGLVSSRQAVYLRSPMGLFVTGAGVLSLIHIAAPFPYEDYQVLLMPAIAALTASGLCNGLDGMLSDQQKAVWKRIGVLAILLFSVAAAFSSPLNQDWMVRERDRIWWRLKDQPDLVTLQETGAWLTEQMGPNALLFTQDIYLAVETGASVPAGLELGPFSYYPDWGREKADRRNVLNRESMVELLTHTEAAWAAMSGYGLAISSPNILEVPEDERASLLQLLETRYAKIRTVDHFGQAHTPLTVYRLKNGAH